MQSQFLSHVFRTNYTNFTIGAKFRNFMQPYNVMELYFFRTNFLYWVTSPQFRQDNSFLLLYTAALSNLS